MSCKSISAVMTRRGITDQTFRVLFWLTECECNGDVYAPMGKFCEKTEMTEQQVRKQLTAIEMMPGVKTLWVANVDGGIIHGDIDWHTFAGFNK